MHRIFRKALDVAGGDTYSIIAVIIDIRDFSAFSQKQDSYDIAMFLRRVYMNIIDSYFDFASFYKSTGDGLLLTIPFSATELGEMAKKTIASCMACHCEFGNICSGDPMIHFPVPDKIGIGVAKGSACCLISGRKIIDYSGRLLNLTSRLTDLAKPSGIVIDQSLGIDLLDENTRNNLEEQDVYLDTIHEDEPIKVYFTKEFTTIPERNKRPIAAKRWRYQNYVKSFSDIAKIPLWFQYPLESNPISDKSIEIIIRHQSTKGELEQKYGHALVFEDFKYQLVAGKPVVFLNFQKLRQILQRHQVKESMDVFIEIAYVER